MVHYQLDYAIEEIIKSLPSLEQRSLKNLVGTDYSKEEANYIWERVLDHKWYLGERLQRDIGFRVAAVDYVENFYDSSIFRGSESGGENKRGGLLDRLLRPISNLTRSYFVSKSRTLSNL